jgi:hypothetical protein
MTIHESFVLKGTMLQVCEKLTALTERMDRDAFERRRDAKRIISNGVVETQFIPKLIIPKLNEVKNVR